MPNAMAVRGTTFVPGTMARRLPPPLSTLPLSVCPWRAFYPSPVRISMARRLPVISHSGWATVKLGIDLGGVFSKAAVLAFKLDFEGAPGVKEEDHGVLANGMVVSISDSISYMA